MVSSIFIIANLSEENISFISALKTDAVCFSETVVPTYRNTGYHNLGDRGVYAEQLCLEMLIAARLAMFVLPVVSCTCQLSYLFIPKEVNWPYTSRTGFI
jgi:hypothetical protein